MRFPTVLLALMVLWSACTREQKTEETREAFFELAQQALRLRECEHDDDCVATRYESPMCYASCGIAIN